MGSQRVQIQQRPPSSIIISQNSSTLSKNSSKDSTRGKKASPNCARCKAHGYKVGLAKHKLYCYYKNCKCELCNAVKKRQKEMAKQTAQRRAEKLDKERREKYGDIAPPPMSPAGSSSVDVESSNVASSEDERDSPGKHTSQSFPSTYPPTPNTRPSRPPRPDSGDGLESEAVLISRMREVLNNFKFIDPYSLLYIIMKHVTMDVHQVCIMIHNGRSTNENTKSITTQYIQLGDSTKSPSIKCGCG